METRTKQLIELLPHLNSRNDFEQKVNEDFLQIKLSLQRKGYKFRDEKHFDDIILGQQLNNKSDLIDIKYYEELGFIRRGINENWSTNFADIARFNEIQNNINDLLERFND